MTRLVGLVVLADPTTGGWITYTGHLALGLIEAGYTPVILKCTKRTEKTGRPFSRGLEYWNTSTAEIQHFTTNFSTIITAVGKKYREDATRLTELGASLVIHDPTELDPAFRTNITGADIITIRPIISAKLTEQGIPNRYTPHPYQRAPHNEPPKTNGAIALSRIDWDKRTHTIIAANLLLPPDNQITIYGTLNTIYEYQKLRTVDPEWKRNYAGPWSPKEPVFYPVELARKATQVIDLSVIKGDGGGTQYSFLEAFDAETPLITHTHWLTGNPTYDEILPAIAGHAETAEELAELVTNPPTHNIGAVTQILKQHDAKTVAELTLNL